MIENVWRAIILATSLLAAGGASLTFIMFRASRADQRNMRTAGNDELALLGRRVIRAEGSRLTIFSALLLAMGTLWTVPASAANLADIAVRVGFGTVFGAAALVLFIVAVRDLMDTLHLLADKPLPPREDQTP